MVCVSPTRKIFLSCKKQGRKVSEASEPFQKDSYSLRVCHLLAPAAEVSGAQSLLTGLRHFVPGCPWLAGWVTHSSGRRLLFERGRRGRIFPRVWRRSPRQPAAHPHALAHKPSWWVKKPSVALRLLGWMDTGTAAPSVWAPMTEEDKRTTELQALDPYCF